jgi:alkanesulfonate monooxygenase SsuD/methylene tetrahydromethanopterin reductase-like flavin-dependent oxidoreductase (luciferase family)
MTMAIATSTESIRVGPAGVLLAYNSAPQVADAACLLEAFFPGRIDLGVSGSSGGAPAPRRAALLDGRPETYDHFRKVSEVVATLHAEGEVGPIPAGRAPPPIWLLGSSERTARFAAELGLSFCLSLFHTPTPPSPEIAAGYRAALQRVSRRAAPALAVAVAGACADSDEQARGEVDVAANPFVRPNIVGTPHVCRERIGQICDAYGTEDIIFLDLCTQQAARMRSLELLAEACELAPSTGDTP